MSKVSVFNFDIAWTTYISIFRLCHPQTKFKVFTLSDPLIVSVLEEYKVYSTLYDTDLKQFQNLLFSIGSSLT